MGDGGLDDVRDHLNDKIERQAALIERLREALEPFAGAAQVYRDAIAAFVVTGETWADRNASEREQISEAEEQAWTYLVDLDIDHYLNAEAALTASREGSGNG